ncbi:hypothetical protein Taro_001478 [Colocasia esculenta]|uniref:Uncharacterized protein n=1 Tax=Colocasia esculenta TaxID=4460 RepID=A0A843TI90_COLES|nr:hypothetical protein [Colocasia esculenta]
MHINPDRTSICTEPPGAALEYRPPIRHSPPDLPLLCASRPSHVLPSTSRSSEEAQGYRWGKRRDEGGERRRLGFPLKTQAPQVNVNLCAANQTAPTRRPQRSPPSSCNRTH